MYPIFLRKADKTGILAEDESALSVVRWVHVCYIHRESKTRREAGDIFKSTSFYCD
jgi:hypothetical protein